MSDSMRRRAKRIARQQILQGIVPQPAPAVQNPPPGGLVQPLQQQVQPAPRRKKTVSATAVGLVLIVIAAIVAGVLFKFRVLSTEDLKHWKFWLVVVGVLALITTIVIVLRKRAAKAAAPQVYIRQTSAQAQQTQQTTASANQLAPQRGQVREQYNPDQTVGGLGWVRQSTLMALAIVCMIALSFSKNSFYSGMVVAICPMIAIIVADFLPRKLTGVITIFFLFIWLSVFLAHFGGK